MIEIRLDGAIPSKKNQRINTRSGRSFPSAEYTAWQESALWQVRQQTRERFFEPVALDITIIFGRNTRSDLDNRLASILDMLVESLVIRDDRWQYVPQITIKSEFKKNAAGAIIRISPVDPVVAQ